MHGSTEAQTVQPDVQPRAGIKVLLVDSHQLLAQALATALRTDSDLEVVGVQPYLTTAGLRRTRPEVLVLSYALMLANHAQLTADLRAEFPELKIIVRTAALDEETLAASIQMGAVGCVTRHQSPAELAGAIKRVHAGEVLFAPETLVQLLLPSRRPTPDPGQATQQCRSATSECSEPSRRAWTPTKWPTG